MIVYRALAAWTDPVSVQEDSPFRAGWSDTADLLRREVDMLTDTDQYVVIEVDTAEGNIRADGRMRADARVNSDGVVVSFDSRHGPLRYATDQFRRAGWQSKRMPGWQCNVRAIALSLEALRKVDRYGVTHRGEQYTGWKALGSGIAMPKAQMTVEEARRLLLDAAGQRNGNLAWTSANVTVLYRQAAKRMHPDAGGDTGAFRLLTEARDLLASVAV